MIPAAVKTALHILRALMLLNVGALVAWLTLPWLVSDFDWSSPSLRWNWLFSLAMLVLVMIGQWWLRVRLVRPWKPDIGRACPRGSLE